MKHTDEPDETIEQQWRAEERDREARRRATDFDFELWYLAGELMKRRAVEEDMQ